MVKKIIIIIIAIAMIVYTAVPSFNEIANLDESVKANWAQVQNQYKRRADLIPNLVNTVSEYAKHENSTLTNVINARSKATSVTINGVDDIENIQKFNEAQGELSAALSRLMVLRENYPQLKADKNFQSLQAQLEGTENRIAVARKDYIDSVKNFNLSLRTLPSSIIAKIFYPELKPRINFEAEQTAQQAPEVNFDGNK